MIKTTKPVKIEKLLSLFIVLTLIAVVASGVGSASASQEYVCIVIDNPDDALLEKTPEGIECEENSKILTCSITDSGIDCDSSKADCEGSVREGRKIASVQCGEPLNVSCEVYGTGSSCEGRPAPDFSEIDRGGPKMQGEDATIQEAGCVGKWSHPGRSESPRAKLPDLIDSENVDGTSPTPNGNEVLEDGPWIRSLLQKVGGKTEDMDRPYMPGTVSSLFNESDQKSDEVAASILSYAAEPAIEIMVANFAQEEEPEFPTVSWKIECHGTYAMMAQCNGSLTLEERQCALVTQSKNVSGYSLLPGGKCNYNYLDATDQQFVSNCMAEHAAHVDARPESGTPYKGILSDDQRTLPLKSQVCWDTPVWVMNRALNDPGNRLHAAEGRQGHDNLQQMPQEKSEDCGDWVRIKWEPLEWEVHGSPHCDFHSYKQTYRYDPNTSILEKKTQAIITK